MNRDFPPEEEQHPPPEPTGRVGPTSAGTLTGFALVGLVLGWLLRPVAVEVSGSAPTVGWLPVLTLLFVATIMGAVAWLTYRALHRRGERIEAYRAVNRLVLAKSCALAGAMVGGGYFGYALSWLGIEGPELAEQRMVRSLVGGVAGALIVLTSLLLERSCRVDDDDRQGGRPA